MNPDGELLLEYHQRYGENILRNVLGRSEKDIAEWRKRAFYGGTKAPLFGHRSAHSYILHEIIPLRLWTQGDHLHRVTLQNRIEFALGNEDFSKDSADFTGVRDRISRVLADYGE
jgi:hypothetical protein